MVRGHPESRHDREPDQHEESNHAQKDPDDRACLPGLDRSRRWGNRVGGRSARHWFPASDTETFVGNISATTYAERHKSSSIYWIASAQDTPICTGCKRPFGTLRTRMCFQVPT